MINVTPSCFKPVQAVPHHVARLRIEAGGRFVEQQQVRLVDQ